MICNKVSHPHPERHETQPPSRLQTCFIVLFAALIFPALVPPLAHAQQMKLLTSTNGWGSNNGHLYWTTDSGSHWADITPIPPNAHVRGVGIPSVFFLNAQEGWAIISYPETVVPLTPQALRNRKTLYDIAQTVDGGQTWPFLPLAYLQLPHWEQVAQGPPGDMFSLDLLHGWLVMAFAGNSQPGRLVATEDGGKTWRQANGVGYSGVILFTSPEVGWFLGGPYEELFATRDGCKTWHEVRLPVPPQVGAATDATFQAPPTFEGNKHGFLAVHYSGRGQTHTKLAVFSTSDAGKTWRLAKVMQEARVSWQGSRFPFSFADSVILVATGEKAVEVRRVRLAGEVETGVAASATGTIALSFADPANGWALGTDGRLLSTSDGGSTWKNVTPWHIFRPKRARPRAQGVKPRASRTGVAPASETNASHQGVWHHFTTNRATPEGAPARSDPPQSSGARSMARLAKQMWALVNRDRKNPANAAETHGRARPLKWNPKLAAVALAHSRDMLRRRYFAHVDPEGRTPTDRINAAGIHWRALAENIALNQTVTDAEKDLMDEPRFQQNHRGNILNPEFTEVGIGIVQAPNGNLYITQDFVATPPRREGPRSSH